MSTKWEKEIEETKKLISLLEKKLENLESLSDLEDDLENLGGVPNLDATKKLFDFPDFPKYSGIPSTVKRLSEDFNPTVGDLINSSPEKLLQQRGMGKQRLKQLTDWMEKHGYSFIQ